jgi:hypothetical protein
MKNSGKNIIGLGMFLFVLTAAGFGQQGKTNLDVKTVQGYKIGNDKVISGVEIREKESIKVSRTATLEFTPKSTTAEVKVNMTEDYNYLDFSIEGHIKSGSITVDLIDPKGDNKGTFNLKLDEMKVTGDAKVAKVEVVTGAMKKCFSNPLNGSWIIRATPVVTEASVYITIIQEFRRQLGNTYYVDDIHVDSTTIDKPKKKN